MNYTRHILFLSAILCSLFIGCAKNDEEPSIIYNLDEEFEIRPVELLSPAGNRLMLQISAIQEEKCSDSEILYRHTQVNGVATISLNDITQPDQCVSTEIAPYINISINQNGSKTRLLNIMIKEIIENTGQIDEYEDHYELKMNSTDGIRIVNRALIKMESDILWGGTDYSNTDSEAIANAFTADITDIAQAQQLEDGYYGYFEVNVRGDIDILDNRNALDYRSPFAFQSDVELSAFSKLVADYRSDHPELHFYLYNGSGGSL